jgi:hypothetical protein
MIWIYGFAKLQGRAQRLSQQHSAPRTSWTEEKTKSDFSKRHLLKRKEIAPRLQS